MIPVGSEAVYVNDAGAITLAVSRGTVSQSNYFAADGTPWTQGFHQGDVYINIVLYDDGNIRHYDSTHPDGSHIYLAYADSAPFTLFGPDKSYSHGAVTHSQYSSSATGYTIQQSFDAGHLTQYNLDYNDVHIAGNLIVAGNYYAFTGFRLSFQDCHIPLR